MKKRFIFFAALAVVLAIAVTPADAPPKSGGIVKGPYLQQLTPDSIVIMWETKTAADSRVDYDDGVSGPASLYVDESVKIHEVLLDGLDADTMYSYTVTSGGTTSPTSTFWTAPAAPRSFRFVAYGDTRTNAKAHAAVVQAIIASVPELVIHTGDLVEFGNEYSQWGRQFFDPAHDLMINTPLLPIIGNHEGSALLFRDFFSLPNNPEDWFAFSYSNVRFIGLNTHNASGGYSPSSDQYNWLVNELESTACTSADWQIVYFHHPPYSRCSGHSDDMNVQTYLVPLFEQYGVDMVFSGHSHIYERYLHNGVYYIVTGGGGAPLATLYEDTTEPIRQFGAEGYHHCVIDVDVENSQLIFEARYNDGTPLDGPIFIQEPVDVTPPTASLIEPLDNGADDLDGDSGEVTVNTTQSIFQIQLSDVGDGINDGTVTVTTVAVTKDEGEGQVPLTEGTDYSFSYNETLDVITLTPIPADSKFGNGLYVITLSGIADIAGNAMEATLTIKIDTSFVPPETLSFQQGVDGYSAMVDTMIRAATPDDNYDDSATEHYGGYQYQYNADTESSGVPCQILLRFDGIIGPDPGQIPEDSTIVSATLRIRSTDDGNGGKLHRMLVSWVDTVVTWNNSFGGDGIQADDTEAASVEDHDVPLNNPNTDVDLDVTATVQAWVDGGENNGWAILPNGTNGWHIAAAEHPTLGYRPELIVTFTTTGNRPPIADAGSDQTVSDADGTEAEIVTLDGSGSYDPDGTISTYEWKEGANVLGDTVSITMEFTVGTHTITLTVTDDEEATDSDDVVITVNANQAPVANAGPDQTPTDTDQDGSETVTLDGSASFDPDGTITAYAWSEGGNPLGTGATLTTDFSVSGSPHTVTLTVTDNAGATATDDVVITVNPGGAIAMHVDSIAVSTVDLGKGKKGGRAEVVILDNNGSPVEGATVTGIFSEDINETVTSTTTTNSSGLAVLETTTIIKGRCHLTFCVDVDGVVHATLTYKPEDNVETCDKNY